MASFYVKYNNLLDKTIKYLGSPKEELREKAQVLIFRFFFFFCFYFYTKKHEDNSI